MPLDIALRYQELATPYTVVRWPAIGAVANGAAPKRPVGDHRCILKIRDSDHLSDRPTLIPIYAASVICARRSGRK